MRSVWGNACRAIVRVRIPGYAWKKRRIEKCITSYAFLPSDTDSARRDTNKHTNKHPIKAVWTLASARRYWSNVFCIATGIRKKKHNKSIVWTEDCQPPPPPPPPWSILWWWVFFLSLTKSLFFHVDFVKYEYCLGVILRRTPDYQVYSHQVGVALCQSAHAGIFSTRAYDAGCGFGVLNQPIVAWFGSSASNGKFMDTLEDSHSPNTVKRHVVCEFRKYLISF